MTIGAANTAGRPVPGRAAIWMLSIDTTLLAAWLALVVVGLVMVTSAASMLAGGVDHYLLRHGIYAIGAVALGGAILLLPLRLWELAHRLVLVAAVALCCLLFVPGLAEEINGLAAVDFARPRGPATRRVRQAWHRHLPCRLSGARGRALERRLAGPCQAAGLDRHARGSHLPAAGLRHGGHHRGCGGRAPVSGPAPAFRCSSLAPWPCCRWSPRRPCSNRIGLPGSRRLPIRGQSRRTTAINSAKP